MQTQAIANRKMLSPQPKRGQRIPYLPENLAEFNSKPVFSLPHFRWHLDHNCRPFSARTKPRMEHNPAERSKKTEPDSQQYRFSF